MNWTNHNGSFSEQSYSDLDQINTSTIARLGLQWSLDLPDESILEATPLAVDGVLYFTGGHSKLYAVNAVTGELLWSYDPEVWKHNPEKMRRTLGVNRGAAYSNGRIFFGTVDGRLIAIDAKSGRLSWSIQTTPPGEFFSITGAPRVFKDKVVIGQGIGDYGGRGYATAYDQKTGQQIWRFYMAPGSPEENRGDPVMEMIAGTWSGDWWKIGTGGGPWDSFTYDEELNRIYIGGGNAGARNPMELTKLSGDRLFIASIVAVNADTGEYIWHYQLNPGEMWDYNCTQQMALAELVIDGRRRKVLLQAPKNGFFYVIDRTNGKLISAEKLGKVTWAKGYDLVTGRPIEEDNARLTKGPVDIWPSVTGAHVWQAMSYNPETGLVYVPYQQAGMRYGGGRLEATNEPGDGKGALIAWDPLRNKAAWTVRHDTFWNGGALSTAGALVFQGAADGFLSAYDARSGNRLWRYDAKLGIIAAPIAYAVNGREFVSLLVGYGASNAIGTFSDVGWKYGLQPRRLLTFALDGKAKLPPTPAADRSLHPVDDPDLKIDPAAVRIGEGKYIPNCLGCHGGGAHSAGTAPDLRESQIALDFAAFTSVVHDGALIARGMPRFDNFSPEDLRHVYAYIRQKARDAVRKNMAAAQTNRTAGT